MLTLLSLAAAVLTAPLSQPLISQSDTGGVPTAITDHMTEGVNITRWFCYLKDPKDTAHFSTYMKGQDFDDLKRLNVKFVRLCLAPDAIYDDGKINQNTLPELDKAVETLTSKGFVVLWDLHDNGQLKLDAEGHDNSGFVSFWQEAARHYKGKYEHSLVFELLNEPTFPKNPSVWYTLQDQTVGAVRANDPSRTIMVTSTSWSGIDTFAKMTPLPEKNLLYTFHCYDPFFFTHQGATWAGDEVKPLKSMPFPSSPEAVAKMIDQVPESSRALVTDFGNHHYNKGYLKSRIDKAANWGKENHLPVVLGEFGAFPPVSPPASRARWFEDMRSVLDEDGVARCLWGYDDGFGLGRSLNPDGTVHLDPVCLKSYFKSSL